MMLLVWHFGYAKKWEHDIGNKGPLQYILPTSEHSLARLRETLPSSTSRAQRSTAKTVSIRYRSTASSGYKDILSILSGGTG